MILYLFESKIFFPPNTGGKKAFDPRPAACPGPRWTCDEGGGLARETIWQGVNGGDVVCGLIAVQRRPYQTAPSSACLC